MNTHLQTISHYSLTISPNFTYYYTRFLSFSHRLIEFAQFLSILSKFPYTILDFHLLHNILVASSNLVTHPLTYK